VQALGITFVTISGTLAVAMGGELTRERQSGDAGACFTLKIPLNPPA